VASVSVIASSAVEADIFAKVALLLGTREGVAFLESSGAAGFFIRRDGSYWKTENWPGEESL
jgi:thiamine biosynthesis lipoprotein ApbE